MKRNRKESDMKRTLEALLYASAVLWGVLLAAPQAAEAQIPGTCYDPSVCDQYSPCDKFCVVCVIEGRDTCEGGTIPSTCGQSAICDPCFYRPAQWREVSRVFVRTYEWCIPFIYKEEGDVFSVFQHDDSGCRPDRIVCEEVRTAWYVGPFVCNPAGRC